MDAINASMLSPNTAAIKAVPVLSADSEAEKPRINIPIIGCITYKEIVPYVGILLSLMLSGKDDIIQENTKHN